MAYLKPEFLDTGSELNLLQKYIERSIGCIYLDIDHSVLRFSFHKLTQHLHCLFSLCKCVYYSSALTAAMLFLVHDYAGVVSPR